MSDKKATKVNNIVDTRIELTGWEPYHSEDIPARAEDFSRLVNDLFGEHSGWRGVSASVITEREDQCSVCGGQWEPCTDNGDEPPYCACCGAHLADEEKESKP